MKRCEVMRRLYIIILGIIYAFAIFAVNNQFGDMLSPVLTFTTFYAVLHGFVLIENDRVLKISGVFYALSIFSWFICDSIWGMLTLISHINPQNNLFLNYGYSATNVFLFISIIISGYVEIKKANKIQVLLDVLIISICIAILLWVFVLKQDMQKMDIVKSDFVFMISMIIDITIYAWINVLFFSTRTKQTPLFVKISEAGALIFVITDFFYYYEYFYSYYKLNPLVDGGYMLAFITMAISAYVKAKKIGMSKTISSSKIVIFPFKKETVIIIAPLFILIFKASQIEYFFLLAVAILVYYVFFNYTEKNIYREELLRVEKDHVCELEEKVKERTKEIVRIMNTDVVTGLYNRRYFEEHLSKSCRYLKKEEYINLLYVDINKYKSIRALYGRYTTELLLKKIANGMKKIAYNLGDKALLAYYAEDVFVIALRDSKFYEQALTLSQEIIAKCSGLYSIEDNDIVVTFNIGISCYPVDSSSYEELIKNADSATVYATKRGYNKISQYSEAIGAHINNENKIEMKLKSANFDEEFMLYYQSQVSCDNGSIIGVEALIRWFTKEGKSISPVEFIPIAEKSGQIIPLGYWIIEQAANQLSLWKNLDYKELRMAVNVSVSQLREEDFFQRVKFTLNKYNISPKLFEVEITENVPIEYNTVVLENLKALREMGVSIAIDDFGTGYSSLYYLKNIPMDRIKIAKELVDSIEKDAYNHAIIQMVIQIARSKGVKVIAEGVETKEQWECLKVLGCDEIQGYYFAKPVPANQVFANE